MKKLTRLFSLLLCLIMVLNFAACNKDDNAPESNDGTDVVFSYEGLTLSEKEYMYILSYFKSIVVSQQQSYIYSLIGQVYDEDTILAMPAGSDKNYTVADYINDTAIEFAQQILIVEKMCADANVSITNEADIKEINDYIADVEYAYGGTDLFEIALAKLGFSRLAIERTEKIHKLYALYSDYRYGENGIAKIPASTVNEYFVNNYIAYDGCMYSYINNSDGKNIVFDYTDDEISEYFYKNYVKIRHVLYTTVDSSGKKLAENVISAKKADADVALAAIKSGEKTIYDFVNANEDNGDEYTFKKGRMVKEFENAAFEMQIGEVRLVETKYGYHLMQKLEITDEDLFGTVSEDKENTSETSSDDTSDESSDQSSEKSSSSSSSDKKTGVKSEVIAAMSQDKIRAEALETLEKLKSGELNKYPEKNTDKAYYSVMSSGYVDKNSSNDAAFVEILSKLEKDVYAESEVISDSATYILRNLSFEEKDITSDIYSKIEENLIAESYSKLLQSYYDKVKVNNEALKKFDVLSIPLLEDEFFTEY